MLRKGIAVLLCLILALGTFVGCTDQGASGNVFLTAEQYTEIKKTRKDVTPDEPVDVLVNGTKALYEKERGVYFYSITDDDAWETLTLTVGEYDTAYVTDFEKETKAEFLATNRDVLALAYNKEEYIRLSLVFTTMPLLSVTTQTLPENLRYEDDGEDYEVRKDEDGEDIPYDPYEAPPEDIDKPIGEYNTFVNVTLLDPHAAEHGYENGFTSIARAHIRGRSSRKYPKNSYKLELLEEVDGVLVERDMPLLGMRKDGDWNLNGMYSEPSKVRDKVSADIWLAITADRQYPGVSSGYRCEYIEVLVNGLYHGLYLMTERIDRKQVGLTNEDIMYFSEGDLGKHFTDFLNCDDNDDMEISGYTLKWPKQRSAPYEEWVPFGELVKAMPAMPSNFNTSPFSVDVNSLADYEVFIQAVCGVDNVIQNTYYIARKQENGQYEFSFVPWDLDQTFGVRWSGEEPLLTYVDPYSAEMNLNHFWVCRGMTYRNTENYPSVVKDRYNALRETVISNDAMKTMVEEAFATVQGSGAWMRNKSRWPDGGYDNNPYTITDFIDRRMGYLDNLYRAGYAGN